MKIKELIVNNVVDVTKNTKVIPIKFLITPYVTVDVTVNIIDMGIVNTQIQMSKQLYNNMGETILNKFLENKIKFKYRS